MFDMTDTNQHNQSHTGSCRHSVVTEEAIRSCGPLSVRKSSTDLSRLAMGPIEVKEYGIVAACASHPLDPAFMLSGR